MDAFLAKKKAQSSQDVDGSETAGTPVASEFHSERSCQSARMAQNSVPMGSATAENRTEAKTNPSFVKSLTLSSPSSLSTLPVPAHDTEMMERPNSPCSPIASRTRKQVKQVHGSISESSPVVVAKQCGEADGGGPVQLNKCQTSDDTKGPPNQLLLQLPKGLSEVTKHYEDFVKCSDMGTVDIVKEHMKRQWSDKVIPGRKVRIKVNKDICPAVVEECHYVSKISSDYLYCYATAKATVKILPSGIIKVYQFRELIL